MQLNVQIPYNSERSPQSLPITAATIASAPGSHWPIHTASGIPSVPTWFGRAFVPIGVRIGERSSGSGVWIAVTRN